MNNDLISREALKKAILSELDVNDCCKNDWFNGFYAAKNEDVEKINNAPTVARPQGEFVKMLNERIENSVCKFCQMNKHCELCEISRVFMIIALTDKEMNKASITGEVKP